MKLTVSFNTLWQAVDRMGGQPRVIDIKNVWVPKGLDLDDELTGGKQVALEDVASVNGLLGYKGRQVVLYIPDHGRRIDESLKNPSVGKRFHVADCATLDDMRQKKRFDRYHVTNRIDGLFEISGLSDLQGREITDFCRLNVCKVCLNYLNFRNSKNLSTTKRSELVAHFSMEEFFSTYSSVFPFMPKGFNKKISSGYSTDWKKISKQKRQSVGYVCTACLVDLTGRKDLLHVHHINGVKQDNDASNLMVLCADCHRKEPYHGHMHVAHEDMSAITRARRSSHGDNIGIHKIAWAEALRYVDPALIGPLSLYRDEGFAPPEIGFEVTDASGQVIAELEAAWPETKLGIAIKEQITLPGWEIITMLAALEKFKTNPFKKGGRR